MILRAPASGTTCLRRASGSGMAMRQHSRDGIAQQRASAGAAADGAGNRSSTNAVDLESQHISLVNAAARTAARNLCQVDAQVLSHAPGNRGGAHFARLCRFVQWLATGTSSPCTCCRLGRWMGQLAATGWASVFPAALHRGREYRRSLR
jgi:hypothetical protein